jgi:DNA-binding SARP family transcriptional activator
MALGAALTLVGDTVTAKLYLRSLDPLLSHAELPLASQRVLHTAALVLIWMEDYDGARRVLDQLAAAGRRRGMPGVLPLALATTAVLEFGVGDWDRAVASATEAAELAEETGQLDVWARAMVQIALIEGCRGDEACRARVAKIADMTPGERSRFRSETLRGALAELGLALGDPEAAITELEPLRERSPEGNPAPTLWEGALLEAYVEAGRVDDAAALLADFEARLERGRNRRGRSMAARTRGLLATEAAYDAEFATALQLVEQPAVPFPAARVQLLWGRRLLASGRLAEARHRLRAALAIFEQLRAEGWVRRTLAALEASGDEMVEAAVPAPTPAVQDRAILDAAARGETVEEIAAALFLSPTTVERRLAAAGDAIDGAAARPSVFEVRLLGRFEVVRDGAGVTPPAGVAARAVEAVALRGGQLHTEELVEMLWPDTDPGKGRTRLRNVLGRIRRAAGDVLVRRGAVVALAEGAEVDAVRFEDEAARALALASTDPASAERLARAAVGRYRGDLAPDLLYEPWAAAPRERLRQRHVALLDLLGGFAAERGAYGEAASLLERAVDAEPLDEDRYLRAAALLADRQPAIARRFLDRARLVAADLGVPPSPRLLQLEAHLEEAGIDPSDRSH